MLRISLYSVCNQISSPISRYRYRHPVLLTTLTSLVELLYGDSEPPKGLLPLATIHMMASSHSLFLPTMLGTEEELSASPQAKGTVHYSGLLNHHHLCLSHWGEQ